MSWIKRNLFFVLGSVVALVLMGLAGWSLYSKWTLNNKNLTSLTTNYEELKGLTTKNPHPGDAKINNIQNAKEQQVQLSNFVAKTRAYFLPIQRIPSPEDSPKVTDRDFSAALSRTVDQLQKQALTSSVTVASNYNFSFEAERRAVAFDQKGLVPLSIQLGEIKAICDVLFQAKINSLDNIRRERVASEDSLGGLQTDYLTEKRTTNDLAVLVPYEVTFKCFSSELAAVLGGFASSPHAMLIKTINVEGAPITAGPDQTLFPTAIGTPYPVTTPYVAPTMPVGTPGSDADTQRRMMQRYGIGGGRGVGRYGGAAAPGAGLGGVPYRGLEAPQPTYVQPVPQPAAVIAAPKSGVLPTVLDERQLKVTLNLVLIKMLPPK